MQSLSTAEDYLRKAKEAEAAQERAKSASVKNSWESIIVGYLELADMAKFRDKIGLGPGREVPS